MHDRACSLSDAGYRHAICTPLPMTVRKAFLLCFPGARLSLIQARPTAEHCGCSFFTVVRIDVPKITCGHAEE
jgi:hypothetical protein